MRPEKPSNELILVSLPLDLELQLYAESSSDDYTLIFRENSFTKTEIDDSYDGEYYHQVGPDYGVWYRIDTDVDPYFRIRCSASLLPLVHLPMSTPAVAPITCTPRSAHPRATDAKGNQANRQSALPDADGDVAGQLPGPGQCPDRRYSAVLGDLRLQHELPALQAHRCCDVH